MIRLTLLLALGIYLVFVLAPEPEPAPVVEDVAPEVTAEGEITAVTLDTGEVWQIDRVIEPRATVEPQDVVPALPDATDARAPELAAVEPPVSETAVVQDAQVQLLYVTGTRVNLRAGPSTDNAIVTALVQGTETELIAEAADGWFEIRDVATGATGFMSGEFLSPTQP